MIKKQHEQYIGQGLYWIDDYGNMEHGWSQFMSDEPGVYWTPVLRNELDYDDEVINEDYYD